MKDKLKRLLERAGFCNKRLNIVLERNGFTATSSFNAARRAVIEEREHLLPIIQTQARVIERLSEALKEIRGGYHDSRCSYEDLGCPQCVANKSLKACEAEIDGILGE